MPSHFYTPTRGELLHHYTNQTAALNIACSGRLWLSDFARMNDATEYQYAKQNYIAAYQSRRVWIAEVPRYMATLSLVGLEPSTNMFIGCFGTDPDNQHLWERYADQGAGCILSFDACHVVQRLGVRVRRVVYDAENLDEFVQVGLAMLQEQFEEAPDDRDCLSELAKFFVLDLYAFKAPQWSAEREIRVSRLIVRDPSVAGGLVDVGGHTSDGTPVAGCAVKVRSNAYGPTAYIELPFEGRTESALREITLGPRCTHAQAAEFKRLDVVRAGHVKLNIG